jgi:transcriptional repressor NrdR
VAEVEAQEVGMAILAPLRELDEVAYLRYASVYRSFSSLEDFEGEIALLRAEPSRNSKALTDSRTQELIK